MKYLKKTFLFIALVLIILNPYTKIGPLGIYGAAWFIIQAFRCAAFTHFLRKKLFYMLGIVIIGAYGTWVSLLNNIPQGNHVYVSVSFVLSVIMAVGIWEYCKRTGIRFNGLLQMCFVVLLFNSAVVMLQFFFLDFRVFIDGLFMQVKADYSTGVRFRGVASSGGASLSILIPIGIGIALHLYNIRLLGLIGALLSILLLATSCLLIGRTGIILTVIPFLLFFGRNLYDSQKIYRTLLAVLSLGTAVVLLYPLLMGVLEEAYGREFIFYSHQFLLSNGLEEEGTTKTVVEYMGVLPSEFPYVLTGYGFYGGSDFTPWTDSGLSRMFLSVGFLFGVLYYLMYFKIIWSFSDRKNIFVLVATISILIVAEIKEPVLFSQYAARLLVILSVFSQLDDWSYRFGREKEPATVGRKIP